MVFATEFFLSPTAWSLARRRLFLLTLPVLWPLWFIAWAAAFVVGLVALALAVLGGWCAVLWRKP